MVLGLSLTISRIQLLHSLANWANTPYIYALLAIGPAVGLLANFMNRPVPAGQSQTNPITNS